MFLVARPAAALLAAFLISPAQAQDAAPDLKGVWSGVARSVVVGSGYHHPGTETDREPPRIREVRFTYTVRGQDGRLAWGTTASPSFEEPFAWAVSQDGRSVFGADSDGQYRLTILGPDRMENCYAHSALSPSKSIVASCFIVERAGR